MAKFNIKLISNRGTFCIFFFFTPMSKCTKSLWNLYKYRNSIPYKRGSFLDHRVENVLEIMPPWLLQNRALRRDENKVEFLRGQFRNEKLSFFHKKGN